MISYIIRRTFKRPPAISMKWTGTTGGDSMKKAPHEVAEMEEVDAYSHTKWGVIDEKDTGLDDAEPTRSPLDSDYWSEQLGSGEDYSKIN